MTSEFLVKPGKNLPTPRCSTFLIMNTNENKQVLLSLISYQYKIDNTVPQIFMLSKILRNRHFFSIDRNMNCYYLEGNLTITVKIHIVVMQFD